MHVLRKGGDSIAALAMIVIDNPMLPGTGHRICNDCMKGCIFQKQGARQHPPGRDGRAHRRVRAALGLRDLRPAHALEPAEPRAAVRAAVPRAQRARRRPRGPRATRCRSTCSTTASASSASRRAQDRSRFDLDLLEGADVWPPRAVKSWSRARRAARRAPAREGFGGVAEYGITVRWDKNFLTALYLTLARRAAFRVYGGVRFGGTLDVDGAFALGFVITSRSPRARKQADDHRRQEQPHPRRTQGVRFPHGAAAHGRSFKKDLARKFAGAPARARHRRRPRGHRHDDGGGGLLPNPGREVPLALGGARREQRWRRERRRARDLRRRGGGRRAGVPLRARARHFAPSARAPAAADEAPGLREARQRVGRRLARLPPLDEGQPGLPPQPRGDQRVLRGGRALHPRSCRPWRARPRRDRRARGRRVRAPRARRR